ncbi:unnamed protein product, partial [Ascophyllum nodosum]
PQTSWSEREIGPVESELERYFSAKASISSGAFQIKEEGKQSWQNGDKERKT